MNNRANIILVVAMGLLIAGCATSYDIKVSGDPFKPTFKVDELMGSDYPPKTGSIYMEQYLPGQGTGGSDWVAVWSVANFSNGRVHFSPITYGVTPDGFTELMKAKPLISGNIYSIEINYAGPYNASAFFKIVSDGTKHKLIVYETAMEMDAALEKKIKKK